MILTVLAWDVCGINCYWPALAIGEFALNLGLTFSVLPSYLTWDFIGLRPICNFNINYSAMLSFKIKTTSHQIINHCLSTIKCSISWIQISFLFFYQFHGHLINLSFWTACGTSVTMATSIPVVCLSAQKDYHNTRKLKKKWFNETDWP